MKKQLAVLLGLLILCAGVFSAHNLAMAAGDAKKTLRLITFPGYAPEQLVKKFYEETGITVEVTDSSNEDMIAKLRATRGGGFDLAQPSQDRIISVMKQFGIYQPHRPLEGRGRANRPGAARLGQEERFQ